MADFQYYENGKLRTLRVGSLGVQEARRARSIERTTATRGGLESSTPNVSRTLHAQSARFEKRFHEVSETQLLSARDTPSDSYVVPTESIVVEGARPADLRWLKSTYGMEEVEEGSHGKLLLRAPEGGQAGIRMAFEVSRAAVERGVQVAHPNFVRAIAVRPIGTSVAPGASQWNLDNPGNPGLVGADVHALAAWTITRGDGVRVAVLDEGVDTQHPALQPAVVAEADYVDGNDHAHPDGNDAHGTACAGIVVSRDGDVRGLAPEASLVAVRIAKSDASGHWIFDDFATADAIDWAWDEARADVLSNSWGGGPPVDVMTRSFERARTRGRDGRGAVVVVAAGNSQAPIDFPGLLPDVITVGASNEWDERKTQNSRDGETNWGSNYGDTLDLLAPGVHIGTTDIHGAGGYSPQAFIWAFNGTSSATPHVAAAAALILAVAPNLQEDVVRAIVNETADPVTKIGSWNRFNGHGRLNTYHALRLARRRR